MTREEFQKLTQDVVLLDGATGSNLMAAGMPRGICTEAWIMEHKEVLQKLQKAYVEAGSQIVYAPTFGGNRYSLGLHGLQDKLAEMNHALVNISREAVGHKVYVAGDITTTGKMMEPAGDLTYEMAYETYCEQIKVLEDAGVDLIAAETMINIEETLAALDAAASVSSLPVMCTMTVEADGSIFSGGNAMEAAIALEGAGAVAVGINCSVGPDQLVSVVRNIKENVSIPVIAKPNAGMPTIDDQGNAIYSMDAKSFAEHMKVLIAAETMINIEETLAALDAAASVSSLPVMCTMTVEADGSIFSGGNAMEAAIALEGAGAVAVGINCSVGPDQLVSVVRNIKENVSIPVIAKPNAGMPTIDDQGNAIYSMDAKSFAEHMKVLIENGASVVGGCCGTTPEFIREISRSLGR